jgi:LPS-assembly protein
MSIFSKFSLVFLSLFAAPFVQAAANNEPPAESNPCLPDWIAPLQDLPPQDALTEVSGQQLSQPKPDQYRLIGDTKLSQPGLVMLSDELFYDKTLQQAQAFGQVQLHQTGAILLGTRAEFDKLNQRGFMLDIRYQLRDSRAHGDAGRIDLNQSERISDLHQASFTTCPLNDQAWKMHFEDLQINDPKRRLYGYNTWLEFKGLPVFYTPYIDIPMDERASGFLFPYIGSHKTAAQSKPDPLSVVAVPYYFNLAPNYDDTLTLVGIQERGVVLDNEFRYLQPKHSGTLQVSLLNDQLTQKEGLRYVDRSGNIQVDPTLSERWRMSYAGNQNWGYGFSSSLNWQEVSDPDFYNDIPLNFGYTNREIGSQQTRLNRYARINYRNGPLNAHIQHYGYLPLRNGETGFLEKSPEIGLNFSQGFGRLRTNLYAETTEFVRYSGFTNFIEDGYVSAQMDRNNPMGQRTVLQPHLSYRVDQSYGHLQAQVKANFRHYDLIQADAAASTDNNVMQYALKGGLVFERDLSLFQVDLVQTLEPELQWLYVPYVEQQHLQRFDSGRASLDFSNLFSLNRFSGFDRIGDTHQISAAITTRFLTEIGRPLADAAIGQIFYLEDRKIDLGADRLQTDTTSDYFAKLGLHFDRLYFASTAQFDREDFELNQIQNRLKLQATQHLEILAIHQGLNLNPDRTGTKTETLGAGLIWQIHSEWQTVGYVNYDLEDKQRRESLAGIRYDDCCWAMELALEQTQIADSRYNDTLQFMIEFKGLSTVGSRLSDTIKQTLNF